MIKLSNYKYKIKDGYKVVSFLPGSRLSEIKKSIPVLIETINLIKNQTNHNFQFYNIYIWEKI